MTRAAVNRGEAGIRCHRLRCFAPTETASASYLTSLVFLCPHVWGFPGSSEVQNPSANAGDAGDTGSIPGLGRSLGKANGNSLWYSCLEYPMDRGAWGATVSGVLMYIILWEFHIHAYIIYYIHTIIYIYVHMYIHLYIYYIHTNIHNIIYIHT